MAAGERSAQEIMHRYSAIARLDAVQPAFDALLGVVEEVFPIELGDIQQAKEILLGRLTSSACDALHVAVMQRRGATRLRSFDADFDRYPGATRLG